MRLHNGRANKALLYKRFKDACITFQKQRGILPSESPFLWPHQGDIDRLNDYGIGRFGIKTDDDGKGA